MECGRCHICFRNVDIPMVFEKNLHALQTCNFVFCDKSHMPLLILGTLTLVLPKFQEPIALEGICLFYNGSCRKMSLLELSVCQDFLVPSLFTRWQGVGCVVGRADAKTCKEKKNISFVEDLSIWFG